MKAKKTWARNSLLISLVVHVIAFIILALYVTGTVQKVQEMVNATFVPEASPQKPEPRPQPIRPILRPSAPRTQVVDTDIIPVEIPKRASPIPGKSAKSDALPKFSDGSVQGSVATLSLTKDRIAPQVMTVAQVLPSDVAFPASISGEASGPGGFGDHPGIGGIGLGGSGGGHSRAILAAAKAPSTGQSLSMINPHTALSMDDGLADVAQGVKLGRERVPPLPKGEPGGIVVGRGKDIEGRIRFTRLKHHLADWWADPTSMPAVMYWMNNQTKIQADTNIEGGSLTLDSPRLMKCPLAIMTGHDRNIIATRVQGNYRARLSDQERAGLRRYLIDTGGLLLFDSCGHSDMLTTMIKNELRAALPEYAVEWIPNKHELYTCFYDLGGPPPGACRFWKHGFSWMGGRSDKYLNGIFINDRLAAIISDRDYLCATRTKNRPGHGYTGEESPSSYRFLTNVVIYSLTHGGISEHSGYIPEISDADRISIDSPVPISVLMPK